MRTYTDPFTHIGRQSAVALGFFDGLHVGHEKVIGSAVDAAQARKAPEKPGEQSAEAEPSAEPEDKPEN